MAKVKFNPIIEEVSGGFGDLVFREVNGKTILSHKPDFSGTEISEGQAAHRERFQEAVAYGRSVMADSDMRAIYEQAADRKGMPVFALTVADFFNAPSIKEVDLSAYTGQAGDVIKIKAMDDFGVASVHIALTQVNSGTPIENGYAVETAVGSGLWVYTATVNVSSGTNVNINVVAKDYPGGTAVETQSKSIQGLPT